MKYFMVIKPLDAYLQWNNWPMFEFHWQILLWKYMEILFFIMIHWVLNSIRFIVNVRFYSIMFDIHCVEIYLST